MGIATSAQATTPRWHPLAPGAPSAQQRHTGVSGVVRLPTSYGNRQMQWEEGSPTVQNTQTEVWSVGPPSPGVAALVAERETQLAAALQQRQSAAPVSALRRRSPGIRAALEDPARSNELLRVSLRLAEPEEIAIRVAVDVMIAQGSVTSPQEMGEARRSEIQYRGAAAYAAQEPIVAAIQAMGGQVFYRCPVGYCLSAELAASNVEILLADWPSIQRLELTPTLAESSVEGLAVTAGTQMDQFLDQGYDGTGVLIFQVEPDNPGVHYGFAEGPLPSAFRILQYYACSGGAIGQTNTLGDCTIATSPNFHIHPTGVAGLLIGDLTLGQSPLVSDVDERISRSGYARGAKLISYAMNEPSQYFDLELGEIVYISQGTAAIAFQHILNNYDAYTVGALLNMSAGVNSHPLGGAPDECMGQSTTVRAANDLFQAGVAMFQSAGNSYHRDESQCTVVDPAAAAGVFTVGAHANEGAFPPIHEDAGGFGCTAEDFAARTCQFHLASVDGEQYVRASEVAAFSSRGGFPDTPLPWFWDTINYRSVIDLSGPGCRTNMFDTSVGYSYATCGTSFATPTVAGFAAQFQQFYRAEINDSILDPGLLYVNMLLMGDRSGGSQPLFGFSNLSGGGRLRARMWNEVGMDGPWEHADGVVCVPDGGSVTLPLWNDAAIPADVDSLKVALWYYDSGQELGLQPDSFYLYVIDSDTGIPVTHQDNPSGDGDVSFFDNKKFAYIPGSALNGRRSIEIYGAGVTNTPECAFLTPEGGRRVYYAYYLEDADRDDSNGPSNPPIAPENQVVQSLLPPLVLGYLAQVPSLPGGKGTWLLGLLLGAGAICVRRKS